MPYFTSAFMIARLLLNTDVDIDINSFLKYLYDAFGGASSIITQHHVCWVFRFWLPFAHFFQDRN